jgi:hypothetical protein
LAATRVQSSVPRSRSQFPRRLFLIAMLAGSALIAANSLTYFDFDAVAPFVVERLPEQFASLWLASLRVHVAAALLSFPLCVVLMSRRLQRRPAWHRWIGRVAGTTVVVALVPSGVVLAFHAKGGPLVTAGFLLSAAILAVSMVRGVRAARCRDLRAHQRAMRHVVGQMSVAVTSRALLLGADAVGIDPDFAYIVALWGPVLATVALVEVVSLHPDSVAAWATRLLQGDRRESSSLVSMVRIRSLLRPLGRLGR